MRIGSSSPQPVIRPTEDVARLQHQASVLKKALESQKESAQQLMDMIEPKGTLLDIRA